MTLHSFEGSYQGTNLAVGVLRDQAQTALLEDEAYNALSRLKYPNWQTNFSNSSPVSLQDLAVSLTQQAADGERLFARNVDQLARILAHSTDKAELSFAYSLLRCGAARMAQLHSLAIQSLFVADPSNIELQRRCEAILSLEVPAQDVSDNKLWQAVSEKIGQQACMQMAEKITEEPGNLGLVVGKRASLRLSELVESSEKELTRLRGLGISLSFLGLVMWAYAIMNSANLAEPAKNFIKALAYRISTACPSWLKRIFRRASKKVDKNKMLTNSLLANRKPSDLSKN